MKKKVLLVPSWYPSASDPISGIFIQEQACTLAVEYDVAVLIPLVAAWRSLLNPRAKDRSSRSHENGITVYREFARPVIPHGPESIAYHTFVRAAHNGYRKILKDWGKPDIIHAHVVLPGGWAALSLGKHYSIPVVLTEHARIAMHLETKLQKRLVRQTLSQVDRVVTVSPALADQLVAFHPEVKPIVIGELILTDFFSPNSNGARAPKGVTKFLFIGRLSGEKGVTHLLKAAYLLAQRGVVSFELILAGDGPERFNLERLAASLTLGSRCKFLGSLSREEVRRCMQDCDVFVLPSLHETFGIVVGEAMASGKPVIATRCGGPEFIVTSETGVLVDVANPEKLADAMSNFISRGNPFHSSVIRGSVVNRFGPKAFVENISRVYEELWQRDPRRNQSLN